MSRGNAEAPPLNRMPLGHQVVGAFGHQVIQVELSNIVLRRVKVLFHAYVSRKLKGLSAGLSKTLSLYQPADSTFRISPSDNTLAQLSQS